MDLYLLLQIFKDYDNPYLYHITSLGKKLDHGFSDDVYLSNLYIVKNYTYIYNKSVLIKLLLNGVEVYLEINITLLEHFETMKGKVEDKHQTVFACMNDRAGNFAFLPIKTMKMGTCSSVDLKRALENINFSGKTIITDSGTGICSFVKGLKENDETITHKSFISADVKKGLIIDNIHNNNINNVMMLYKKFQDVFKGYSTKYQWNYLAWFKLTRFFNILFSFFINRPFLIQF